MSSRKIPLFSRPAASVSRSGPKRVWQMVPAGTLRMGDMLSDYGVVTRIDNVRETGKVRVWAGDREYFIEFPWVHELYAFIQERS